MEYLETVEVADDRRAQALPHAGAVGQPPQPRFPRLLRHHRLGHDPPRRRGDVASSGQTSRVARIVTMDGDLEEAVAGQAVTLTLTDEIDISRGDTLAAADERPYQADQLEAKLVWLHEEPLRAGAQLPAQGRQRHRPGPGTANSSSGSTSTAWSRRKGRRWP